MRILVVVSIALVLAACGRDPEVAPQAPTATILAPVGGLTFGAGETVPFVGRVTDPDDPLDSLRATWRAGTTVLCSAVIPSSQGEVTCDAAFDPGPIEVSLEVVDPGGLQGSDTVFLDVVAPGAPQVEIVEPVADGGRRYADVPIDLRGIVSDPEFQLTELRAVWDSDLDGLLSGELTPTPDGEVSAQATLTEGEHTLGLRATNPDGLEGRATLRLQVGPPNAPPTCSFVEPESGGAALEGESITFRVRVADPDIPAGDLEVVLESDRDGILSSLSADSDGNASFTTDLLSRGTHRVTLTATDEVGSSCEASILWTVGVPPTIVLRSPLDGDVVNEGVPVDLEVSASDALHPATALEVVILSDRDGELLRGAPGGDGSLGGVAGSLSVGTHRLVARATNPDGMFAEAMAALRVNGLPTAPEITIEPDAPLTGDDLRVSLVAESTDPDGDAVTYRYAWAVDGDPSDASVGDTLPSASTRRGQRWSVTVTATDGIGDGPSVTAERVIGNTPPVAASALVTPARPTTISDLTCTAGALTDADGDAVTVRYDWEIDGTSVGIDAAVLSSSRTRRGQEIVCVVTPFDGTDVGAAVRSEPVAVLNTAPVIEELELEPDPAFTSSVLRAVVEASDVDDDELTGLYRWFVDGDELDVAGAELDGAEHFERDDEVEVRVTFSDGDIGSAERTISTIIANSPPTAAGVIIEPEAPTVEDELSCAIDGFFDADGDRDLTRFEWRLGAVDGEVIGEGASLGLGVEKGETVFCIAYPYDGFDEGEPVSASVVGANTPPEILSVDLSPSEPRTDDTIRAIVETYDADGDRVALSFIWVVDDEKLEVEGDSLDGRFFERGQSVSVVVVANDGDDDSEPFESKPVEILNSVPTIEGVSITPDALRVDTVATCAAVGFADADGDEDRSSISWKVDGREVSAAATITVGDHAKRGEVLVCEITPFDGFEEGDLRSVSRTVLNSAPVVSAVVLAPGEPLTNDDIEVTVTATDADGDSLTFSYTWVIDDEKLDVDGPVLSSKLTARGQRISVTVVASDGSASSDPVPSDTVEVGNTPPTGDAAAISPRSPTAADRITCAIVGFFDADDDRDASTFAWFVDKEPVGEGATLPVEVERGQRVTCEATLFDGTDKGEVLSDEVEIVNAPPEVTGVTLLPSPLRTASVASFTYTATDADGDRVDVETIRWLVNGSEVGSGETLDGRHFVKDDRVSVALVVTDGEDPSEEFTSAEVIVANTAPGEPALSFDPESWDWDRAPEELSCLVDPKSLIDADDDRLSLSYVWYLDGEQLDANDGEPEPLSSELFAEGGTVTCEVSVSDGTDTTTAEIALDIPVAGGARVDWVGTWWPCVGEISLGDTFDVYGRVYMAGETDTGSDEPSKILLGEVGFAPEGADPFEQPDEWIWEAGKFNVKAGNDEEWFGQITPREPGAYNFAWRFSADEGRTWVIGDLAARPDERDWCIDGDVGGSDDGYDPKTAGWLSVR